MFWILKQIENSPFFWSHDSSVLVLRALMSIREATANPWRSGPTVFFLLQVEMDRSRASTTLKDLSSQTPYTVSVSAVYDEGESPPATAYETTRELCPVLWTHGEYLTCLQIYLLGHSVSNALCPAFDARVCRLLSLIFFWSKTLSNNKYQPLPLQQFTI